jgi:hypothetical protein
MKDKKMIFSIFIMIILMATTTILSFAQNYDEENDFIVARMQDGRSVRITGYIGSKQIINIPPEIRQLPVTHIGDEVFKRKNITSITIPYGVTYIGNNAFDGNQLTNIIIPNGVTHIGNSAFARNRLTKITIPNSVTHIGREAFDTNLLTSVIIGNGVTHIGDFAFVNSNSNPNFINVTIGNNISLGMIVFPNDFDEFYYQLGRKAGTYTYRNGFWVK